VSASPAPSAMGWSSNSTLPGSVVATPLDPPLADFSTFPPASNAPFTLFPRDSTSHTYETVPYTYETGFGHPQTPMSGYNAALQASPMTSSYNTTPITPAGSAPYSFGNSPFNSYNIDLNLGQATFSHGMPTPASNHIQSTSRNPSISYQSPTVLAGGDDVVTNQPVMPHNMGLANFTLLDAAEDLPAADFDLYDHAGNPNAFPANHDFGGMDFSYTGASLHDIDSYINYND